MKKYLMSGVAAIAFLAAFTSCSKSTDLYDQGAVDEKNKQEQQQKTQDAIDQAKVNYAKAFEAAFGPVDSKVDWGFSSRNAATRSFTRALGDYDNYKGNLEPVSVSFPEDANASNFDPDLTGIPSYEDYLQSKGNANWTPTEINESAVVYIDHVRNVKMTDGKSKLYIKAGEYDFTDEEFNLAEGIEVYLLPGAILTLNNTAASTAKFTLYIASTAELIANGANGLKMDNTGKVYNHGTIECSRFEVNNTAFLYNVGTLTSTGQVYIANSTSRIVNDGTINSASTNVEGSGALQNNAEWTVTGNTVVNCNNGGWVNNGHWTTQNYHYTAGSNNVINNCFLKVTNEFNINMSSASSDNGFKIDSKGGVETVYFNGGKAGNDPNSKSGPYKVIMGHGSVFKVTETATLDGGNKGWGFYGPADGEYAVFQAKNVVRAAGLERNQFAVTYGGNLYVSAETHFAQGNDGDPTHFFIGEEGGFSVNSNIYAPEFNKTGKPSITIKKTPCNPGFTGVDPLYRVIAEDLNAQQASDFDFNDVVFDVVKAENDKTTLRLIACGGIYKLTVAGVEVHEKFGQQATNGLYPMINTGAKADINGLTPVEFDINGTYNTPELINNIEIRVWKPGTGDEGIPLTAEKGKAACKILVDDSFDVVPEKQGIGNEYGLFSSYVQGKWDEIVEGKWWLKK